MSFSKTGQTDPATEVQIPCQAILAGVRVPALLQTEPLCFHLGGINSSTLWRWIRERDFPKPIEVGTKVRMWKAVEVEQWLSSQSSTQSGYRKLTGRGA